MISAKPYAIFAQSGTRRLIEILHLGRDFLALQHAERLDQLERDAARDAGNVFRLSEIEQRTQQLFDVGLQPQIKPRLHRVARCAGQALVGNYANARMQDIVRSHQFGDRVASPADGAIGRQQKLVVGPFG